MIAGAEHRLREPRLSAPLGQFGERILIKTSVSNCLSKDRTRNSQVKSKP